MTMNPEHSKPRPWLRHPRRTWLAFFVVLCLALWWAATHVNVNWSHNPGDVIDEFNGVSVYYNGAINHVDSRNVSKDGYNIGMRWQCVEFVKRYYFERFNHRMPESRGNAKDFYDPAVTDGSLNQARNLLQYQNGGAALPMVDDIVVFAPWTFNPYGHVAIVSRVEPDYIEVIQQNPGPFGASRERFPIALQDGHVRVESRRLLGWLRRDVTITIAK